MSFGHSECKRDKRDKLIKVSKNYIKNSIEFLAILSAVGLNP